jgi:hypothetical protein
MPSNNQNSTITLTKREAKELILEIADRCEAAYRRGAQHAVVLGLNAEDASWYRHYGVKAYKNGFRYQHALRIPESGIDSKTGKPFTGQQYSKGWKVPLTRAVEMKFGGMIQRIAWKAGLTTDALRDAVRRTAATKTP